MSAGRRLAQSLARRNKVESVHPPPAGKRHTLRNEHSLEKSCIGPEVEKMAGQLLEQSVPRTGLSEDLSIRAICHNDSLDACLLLQQLAEIR